MSPNKYRIIQVGEQLNVQNFRNVILGILADLLHYHNTHIQIEIEINKVWKSWGCHFSSYSQRFSSI